MMAYRLVLLATCVLVLTGTSLIAEDFVPVGKVVMNRDIYISDSGRGELPRAKRGQVFPCLGETGGGYLVVCRDAANRSRAAFIPYRTEWGHVTAKSSKHDETMEVNTIEIQVSMALKPGAIPLVKGKEFPVVESGKNRLKIRFEFEGLSRDISILAEDGSFEPAPATTGPPPPLPREEVLEKEIAASEAMQKELLEKLAEAEEKRENLGLLLQRLNFIEIDNAQLVAEVARSTEAYRELIEWAPDNDGVMKRLKNELKTLIERQAGLSARIKKAQLDAEPLQLVFAQLRAAENEAETLKVDVAKEEAVAAGLRANANNEIVKQGKDRIKVLLEEAADKNADLTKAIVRMESGKQDVISLVAILTAVKAENTALEAQVKALADELAKLRRMLAPPAPRAKVEREDPEDANDAKRRREREAALERVEKLRKKKDIKKDLEKNRGQKTGDAPAPAPVPKKAPVLVPANKPEPVKTRDPKAEKKAPVADPTKKKAPATDRKPASPTVPIVPAALRSPAPPPVVIPVPALENKPPPLPVVPKETPEPPPEPKAP